MWPVSLETRSPEAIRRCGLTDRLLRLRAHSCPTSARRFGDSGAPCFGEHALLEILRFPPSRIAQCPGCRSHTVKLLLKFAHLLFQLSLFPPDRRQYLHSVLPPQKIYPNRLPGTSRIQAVK